MAFEAVLITHLAAAGLTEPSQALEAFRLHLVGDRLGGAGFCTRHDSGKVGEVVGTMCS